MWILSNWTCTLNASSISPLLLAIGELRYSVISRRLFFTGFWSQPWEYHSDQALRLSLHTLCALDHLCILRITLTPSLLSSCSRRWFGSIHSRSWDCCLIVFHSNYKRRTGDSSISRSDIHDCCIFHASTPLEIVTPRLHSPSQFPICSGISSLVTRLRSLSYIKPITRDSEWIRTYCANIGLRLAQITVRHYFPAISASLRIKTNWWHNQVFCAGQLWTTSDCVTDQ